MQNNKNFILKDEHILLLKHLRIMTDEEGYPVIDSKPFGNSYAARDIREILRGEAVGYDEEMRDEEYEYYMQLLSELAPALNFIIEKLKIGEKNE